MFFCVTYSAGWFPIINLHITTRASNTGFTFQCFFCVSMGNAAIDPIISLNHTAHKHLLKNIRVVYVIISLQSTRLRFANFFFVLRMLISFLSFFHKKITNIWNNFSINAVRSFQLNKIWQHQAALILNGKKQGQFFRKENVFYTLIFTRTCTYQGVRNVRFFGKFGLLCFLVTPFGDSPFTLLSKRSDEVPH